MNSLAGPALIFRHLQEASESRRIEFPERMAGEAPLILIGTVATPTSLQGVEILSMNLLMASGPDEADTSAKPVNTLLRSSWFATGGATCRLTEMVFFILLKV